MASLEDLAKQDPKFIERAIRVSADENNTSRIPSHFVSEKTVSPCS